MSIQRIILGCVVVSLASVSAAAQARRADSLLAAGRLVAAESAYYAAVRARPRDPDARRQLGRYLGQRGAPRVAAVLLEEARTFGGDAATIARDLVPLYRRLDDFRALATLPSSPLGEGDRAQAAWLVAHPPAIGGEDSARVAYRLPTLPGYLGRVALDVDGHAVDAVIDPARSGIVIDVRGGAAPRRRFAAHADQTIPAVADTLRIGNLKLANVPVVLDLLPERLDAAIGLDVLQRFAATFDPRSGLITLHIAGTLPAGLPGIRVPTLTGPSDVRVLQGGKFVPITTTTFATLLRTKRWTLDGKRGAIVIDG